MRPSLLLALTALISIIVLALPTATTAMAAAGPGWEKLGKHNIRSEARERAAPRERTATACTCLWRAPLTPLPDLRCAVLCCRSVGAKFLESTAHESDILQLDRESGILYRVLESGAGTMHPGRSSEVLVHHASVTTRHSLTSLVRCHSSGACVAALSLTACCCVCSVRLCCAYSGKTIKGHVFEDTWARNSPQRLTVGGLLACWTRALQKMVVGDEWEVVCPAKMAYGQRHHR